MHFDTVIVGGGAGGLELAARLGRRMGRAEGRERLLLVDRFSFHIWKPTLHEVAAGTLDLHQEGLPYTVLARRNHFAFMLGALESLHAPAHTVTLGALHDDAGDVTVPPRRIGYGRLVLALGSGSNSFGTPGIEHAYLLENPRDAERFHAAWLAGSARAAFSPERTLRVAIVGAGATGVELAAELLEAYGELLASLGQGQRFELAITLVEGGPRILGGLAGRISAKADAALRQRGVHVLTDTRMTAIEPGRLLTSSGTIAADLIVWAAGIKAADGNTRYGLQTNRINQFVVDDRLRTSAPDVLALGDCAACPWHDGQTVPARAQAAHQQADWLAHALARPGGVAASPPFAYRDLGSLVSLGDNRGVGSLMGGLAGPHFLVEGLIAKWMYMSLHLNHHRVIPCSAKTGLLALARLLQQRVSVRLKLH